MQPFDFDRISLDLVNAVVDPDGWAKALDAVAELTGSYGAVMLPAVGDIPLVCATPSMERTFNLYVEGGWHNRDERYRGKSAFLANGVYTDDDCMPRETRSRSPFYQDFLAASGLTEFAGVRIGRGDNVWCLSIQRTAAQGKFSKEQLLGLAQLSNNLDAVVENSVALGLAKGIATLDAFQFSERPAVLFNRSGEVVRLNSAAERLMAADLFVRHKRLTSIDPSATTALNQALNNLLWKGTAFLVPPVVLPKQMGGKIVAYPMPLQGLSNSSLSAFHAVMVLVDTNTLSSIPTSTLRTVFDLTEAEARVAVAIGNGATLDDYSRETGVSKETSRVHLQSVFRKTGVQRQHALAALLGTLIGNR